MIKKLIGILLLLILVSPLIMYLAWKFSPDKQMNVLILDKTVLDKNVQEHISFDWVLNQANYTNRNAEKYVSFKDYFGMFPDEKGGYAINDFNHYSKLQLDSLATITDMVYYTDLYGVYEGEWYERYPEVSPYKNEVDNSMEHTQKMYGGMTNTEMSFLKLMKQKNKLILTEYNVIASPTSKDVRIQFQDEFKIKWSGWVGRYYETLDTIVNKELPRWLKRNYLKQHQNNWPFTKSGIVFVNVNEQIEILENETHLNTETPIILTSDVNQNRYNLPQKMKFSFWFDIISTDSVNNIVSNYQIDANSKGLDLLTQYGIPKHFPAVIEHFRADYKFYYFAGDFCDNSIGLSSSKFKWIEYFSDFSYNDSAQERKSFFWEFYRPLVDTILDDYYKTIN